MNSGYIKLYRKIHQSKIWLSEPFTRAQSWIDLILLANYKDGYIRVRGNRVDIKRGQCGWSKARLAERWKWSRGKVIRFLNELEIEQQIVQQKNNITSCIIITNYEQYQSYSTTDSTTDSHQTVQQTDTNNKVKKEKKEKKQPNNVLDFSCWPEMPKDQTMRDWMTMRRRLKANVTQTVINRFGTKLREAVKEGYIVDECVSECVSRNWKGFDVEWMRGSKQLGKDQIDYLEGVLNA